MIEVATTVAGNPAERTRDRPTLAALVAQIGELRPLPAVALRVVEIAESDRFSAHALAQAISADQVLTAKMLRLANSAYYGFPRHIASVRDAVVLLGYRSVRSATLASCVMHVLPPSPNIAYEQFWHFSVAVGILAEILAHAAGRPADEAFTAGVLHNIGRLALDQHRPAALTEARALAAERGLTLAEAERALLGFSDAEFGGALARAWNLPEELSDAIARHQLNADALPDPDSLCAFVVRARLFARSCGIADGVEPAGRPAADRGEWEVPPLSRALRVAGGIDGVLERAQAFVASASHG